MGRRLWIDPATGGARVDRRLERINHDKINRVYQAYRLLEAYANPHRNGMPLSSTEMNAVKQATGILRGTS